MGKNKPFRIVKNVCITPFSIFFIPNRSERRCTNKLLILVLYLKVGVDDNKVVFVKVTFEHKEIS